MVDVHDDDVRQVVAGATPPLLLPRALIFLASIWLIASWMIAMGLRTPVQPTAESYTPGVRVMLFCVTVGLTIAWPMFRLSQSPSPWPVRQTVLDLVVILSLTQVVIWPLRLVTNWTAVRTAALDATIGAWTILIGAIVAASIGSTRLGPRNLAMVACLAICLLGPAAAWLGVVTGINAIELIDLSPLMAVRTLSGGGPAPVGIETWRWIALLGVADVAVWTALLLAVAWIGTRSAPPARA